jgi:predicted small lipoprotein YifL
MGSRYGSGLPQGKGGLLAVMLALALAGCGRAGDLRPPPGQPLPVKPKLATTTPTPEELLTPPPVFRPVRVDEILRRNEPRRPDRFDLPAPSGVDAAPEPEGDSQTPPNDNQTRVQEPQ